MKDAKAKLVFGECFLILLLLRTLPGIIRNADPWGLSEGLLLGGPS